MIGGVGMKKNGQVRWLHVSDLHIFWTSQWTLMVESYKELAQAFTPNFIVVTGDFRHLKNNKEFDNALEFLNDLSKIFSLDKSNFFLVPGNHDVTDYQWRFDNITGVTARLKENPDIDIERRKILQEEGFKEYREFVKNFYGDSLKEDDERICNADGVYYCKWEGRLNIVGINTALISTGKAERSELLDINKLSEVQGRVDTSKPTIVLAHHSIDAIAEEQKHILIRLLDMMNVRAYLCGDEHKVNRGKYNIYKESAIYEFVCGKSAVEVGDGYSDFGVIGYIWENSETKVQVFKWITKRVDQLYHFVQSNIWYHHVDKPFVFKMNEGEKQTEVEKLREKMDCVWDEFLTVFKEEDKIINNRLSENQVRNKNGYYEPFESEKIMRCLITIGIPFPAVAEITKITIDELLELLPEAERRKSLNTKTIRQEVINAIEHLDTTRWDKELIKKWSKKYIRKYGHNNRTIKFCNIPSDRFDGVKQADASYKFVREVFLKQLFQESCPYTVYDGISSTQEKILVDSIIDFINDCDVYIINYEVMLQMVKEIVNKPPHPWFIDERFRQEIIDYDRHGVESNLKEIARCEKREMEIPYIVFSELLHHTSAMMLDQYFHYCGCTDFDAFYILCETINEILEAKEEGKTWNLENDVERRKQLFLDLVENDMGLYSYASKLATVNPQKVHMGNTKEYISAIKDFANTSLKIVGRKSE